MRFREEILLTFRGSNWVAKVGNDELVTDSLEDLDSRLRSYYLESQKFNKGDRISVSYLFDNSCIPEWIRQYSNHYFNRKVEFNF